MEYRLINFMKENNCLHDKFSPLFKCKRTKDMKWHELSSELGIGVPELQKRWKTLRDRFRREDKRFLLSGRTRPVKWKYYRLLGFLKGYCEETETKYLQNEVSQTIQVYEHQFNESKDFKLTNIQVPRKRQKKQPDLDKEQLKNKMIQEINLILDKAREALQSTSVVKAFFNSVAIQIEQANLTFERMAYVQQEVLRVVTEQIKDQRQEQMASSVAYTNLV